MNIELPITEIMKHLQKNKTLAETAANFQMLEQVIKLEGATNGTRTHRMSVLENLRTFQLKRVLGNLVKAD